MNNYLEQLADRVVNYSLSVKKGQNVEIKYKNKEANDLVDLICNKIKEKGAKPYTFLLSNEERDIIMSNYNNEDIDALIKTDCYNYSFYDSFLSIGYNEKYKSIEKNNEEVIKRLKEERRKIQHLKANKNWLLFNYPSSVDANNVGMSYDSFYKYAMNAMMYNFDNQFNAVNELKILLRNTNNIKIVGDNVNLTFNKNKIPAISLLGKVNLPDGEVYTSPLKDSATGYIKYNVPSPKENNIFNNVYLEFLNGKVVNAKSECNEEMLNKIINIDSGAKYIGEFAFGFNPMIDKPMNDILYDEKMIGSFHIALGNSYSNAFNGNKSSLHWDLIYLNENNNKCDIYFDNKLVYKKGNFILPKMKELNR
ncbi:MAG: aminopeptidase [Tissierellia bacterium]|nr:aminopeptidase [Tissierellia bacterium]